MKVRTVNRITYVAMAVVLAAFAAQIIAALMRSISLGSFLSNLLPTAALLGLTPIWLKTIRQREATYGPDGTLPASHTKRLWFALGVGLAVAVAAGVLAFVLGSNSHH